MEGNKEKELKSVPVQPRQSHLSRTQPPEPEQSIIFGRIPNSINEFSRYELATMCKL